MAADRTITCGNCGESWQETIHVCGDRPAVSAADQAAPKGTPDLRRLAEKFAPEVVYLHVCELEARCEQLERERDEARQALRDAASWIENYPLNMEYDDGWNSLLEQVRSAAGRALANAACNTYIERAESAERRAERLAAALQRIVDLDYRGNIPQEQQIARAALEDEPAGTPP